MDRFSKWLERADFYSVCESEGETFIKLPLSSVEEAEDIFYRDDISVQTRRRINEIMKNKEYNSTVCILKKNKKGNWDVKDIV